MQSVPLTIERQQSEWKTIQAMAQNNNFPEKLITNLKTQMQQKIHENRIKMKTKNGQPLHIVHKLEIHQSLQTYQHKYCIQTHKHKTALYKTKDT